MTKKPKPELSIDDVIRRDGRYPPEAYGFLHEGLNRASKEIHGDASGMPEGARHVTGAQLCNALKDLAVERWGRLAPIVLGRWNIRQTLDFGKMVYLLIDFNFMKKTETDSIEDFRDVYDFRDAFGPRDDFELKE